MSDEKRAVTVRIAGQSHTIRANAEPAYTKRCAEYVDERIEEIRDRAGAVDAHRVAILAALSITDELFQAREDGERLQADVAERADSLKRQIEAALD